MPDILVENLISSGKIRSLAPISQSTFQESDLITIATEELLLKVAARILKVREDYFATTKSVTIQSGINRYAVPKRAIGNALKYVIPVDSNGNKGKPLPRIDAERQHEYQGTGAGATAFYMEGDEIVVCPTPSTAWGSLLVGYHAKPNRLIKTANCAKISSISSVGGTTTFTVDTDLTDTDLDTVLAAGSKVDIISVDSPFLLWAEQVSITAITTTTIAVSTTDVDDANGTVEPQVGDYICPHGYSNIPMIPEEFHPVLAQSICNRLIAALGDNNKLAVGKAEQAEMFNDALVTIKNRVEAAPLRVTGRNGILNAFSGR